MLTAVPGLLIADSPPAGAISPENGGTSRTCLHLYFSGAAGRVERSVAVLEMLLQLAPATATTRDAHGCVPLHYASDIGPEPDIFEPLLRAAPEAAAIRDERGNVPLHFGACCNGDVRAAQALLRARPAAAAALNADGVLPLQNALKKPSPPFDFIEARDYSSRPKS